MSQRKTLKRLLLAISTDRPLPDDLKGWLTTGISRLLAGQDISWDSALGWEEEPATVRNAQRDSLLKRLAAELVGAKKKQIFNLIKSSDLPPPLKPLLEEAAFYSRIPQSDKQLSRIIFPKDRSKLHENTVTRR